MSDQTSLTANAPAPVDANAHKTVLVTGGAGFIGSNYCRYALQKHPNYRVIVVDALTYAGNLSTIADMRHNPETADRFRFYPGKIQDDTVINGIIKAEKVDYIINFAAESHNDRSILEPGSFIQTDVYGVFTLLDATKQNNVDKLLHVSCYDEQTRALTKSGFKTFDEINVGDKVLSLNAETGFVEEKTVEKVIVQDYDGDMIHFKSNMVDLLVTPNHRMFYEAAATPNRIRVDAAEDVSHKTNVYLPRGKWCAEASETVCIPGLGELPAEDVFYLAGVFIGDGFLARQEQHRANKTGLARPEYLKKARDSAGRFYNPGKIGTEEFTTITCHRIFFDIPLADKARKRLEITLCNLGISWSAHKGKAGEHIYFSSKEWSNFFAQFGHGAAEKHIPAWMLEHDAETLRCLFDGLIDSDGHYRGKNKLPCYSTCSTRLVENLCEIGFKLGYLPRYSLRRDVNAQMATGRVIRKTRPSYMVFFRTGNVGISKEVCSTKPYQGKIWCLRVQDNKNFIVERSGILAFCGNTDEVYGTIDDGQFTEQSPIEPNTPYSASKAGGEMQVRAHRVTYGTPAVVTRCGNNFGPFQYPEKLIPFFVTRLIDDKKVPLYGTGQQVRDWVYVMDHCSGIDHVLHYGTLGEAYNVGSDGECTNMEITQRLLQLLDKPDSLIKYIGDPRGGAHDKRYSINSDKLKALGWQSAYDFDAALEQTVRWYVDNQQWWRDIIATSDYQDFVKRFYGKYLGEDL